MSFKLNNEYISLDIREPGEFYRDSRFDWTGQITQVTYLNKHTFCTAESLDEQLVNKQGCGLNNEFGIESSLGYDDCCSGGKFHKIGVGLLTRKSTEPYNFFEDYAVSPYPFSFKLKDESVKFYYKASPSGGYSFQFEKQITLNENTFTINYRLKNCGGKTIHTNEYVHNFLAINGRPVSKYYRLYFPFEIKSQKINKLVNPEEIVRISGNSVNWNSIPGKQFFLGKINTGYRGIGKWALIHLKEKIGIQESTNFNLQKINLWGAAHVISPEIFFEINAASGESVSWSRTYSLFSLKNLLTNYR